MFKFTINLNSMFLLCVSSSLLLEVKLFKNVPKSLLNIKKIKKFHYKHNKNTLFKMYLLQLLLHNPADSPTILQPTAYVSSSSMLSISLNTNMIQATSKIKNWTPKTRNCYYQHEKKLKFFKIYTYHNCEVECRANNTLRVCGCNAFYQPSENL